MRALLALGLVLLLSVTGAQAQAVPTTMYLHLIDYQDMPINTQAPVDPYSSGTGFGVGSNTLRCLDPVTGDVGGTGQGTAGMTSQEFHTSYGYTTPSLVEYGFGSAQPRTQPTRGLWQDVTLDAGAPVAVHWYLLASTGQDPQVPGQSVPVVPDISVHAAIRSGDDISVDDAAYNAGTLLFSGKAGPATLANGEVVPGSGLQGEVRPVGQVGDAWLYEFVVPLQGTGVVLDAKQGFNVRLDAVLESEACADVDHALAPGSIQAYSIPGHRPRVEWSVVDPLSAGQAVLHLNETGRLHVVADAASVFGNYDVSNLSVTLTRTNGKKVTDIPLERTVTQEYGSCGHDCGHVTVVSYTADELDGRAPPGVYDLRVSYDNLQGTAHRDMAATLTVEKAAESPGLPPVVLLGLLALLGLAWRRR